MNAQIFDFNQMPVIESNRKSKIEKPSIFQLAIFNWVKKVAGIARKSRRCLIVGAGAGSGKTSTMVAIADFIPAAESAVFLAFNKPIAEQLGARLPCTVESRTLNSLGNGAVRESLGSVELDQYKVRKIIDELTFGDKKITFDMKRSVASLVSKAKAHGYVVADACPRTGKGEAIELKGEALTSESWTALADHYDIQLDSDDQMMTLAHMALRASIENTSVIDFDDQMYLTVIFGLRCRKYDWVIVDEAQDVSHVQRTMIDQFLADNGVLICVGDANQAIYGFRGADSYSLINLKERFHADELPLSVTYRCALSIVREAQKYQPTLQPREDAPEGVVRDVTEWNVKDFRSDDLIICRYTAPIIDTAYKLFGARIACYVKGRDIGEGLVSLVRKMCGFNKPEYFSQRALLNSLETWRSKEMEKAAKKDNERLMDSITDRYNSLVSVIENTDAPHAAQVIAEIQDMFNPENGGICLSSVHRAKGLEADRVFILNRDAMPSARARKEWQITQEYNLIYVAITRAKMELINLPAQAIFA